MEGSAPIDATTAKALLALNNEHAEELSALDAREFDRLTAEAFHARSIGTEAFILAFDQDASYDSPNFQWFREGYRRFVYIDRVVVSPIARGRGWARLLYGELFEAARNAGHDRVFCEVNIRPPNLSSDSFHRALGFEEIGQAEIHAGAKLVRYLERRL